MGRASPRETPGPSVSKIWLERRLAVCRRYRSSVRDVREHLDNTSVGIIAVRGGRVNGQNRLNRSDAPINEEDAHIVEPAGNALRPGRPACPAPAAGIIR